MAFRTLNFLMSNYAGSQTMIERAPWMIGEVSMNVFTLGSRVITWNSKKQATIALSSSEAE